MSVQERIEEIKQIVWEAVEPVIIKLVKGMTWIVRKFIRTK